MSYLKKVTTGLFGSRIKTFGRSKKKRPAFLGNWSKSAGLRVTLGLPNTVTVDTENF